MPKPTRRPKRQQQTAPKECAFCKDQKSPSYKEPEVLRRYISDRGKIIGRVRSGLCSKHQKTLTTAVKHARQLAMLPFVGRY